MSDNLVQITDSLNT